MLPTRRRGIRFHADLEKNGQHDREHEYEPIAPPSVHPVTAPVVQIIDTDVVPVADSDDSIDERGLLPTRLILGGDVILPLDGRIEDVAMEGQELGETVGDTSEEQDTPQQLQDRLEEQYLSGSSPTAPTPTTAPTTPGAESRTDGEVNTSQMDSSALEELPLRRDARTLPQRLKSQAGKLSSRLRGIQRPNFSFPKRQKAEKTRSTSSGKSDVSRTEKKRPSRMDRIKTSFAERPRFSLPDRPKFSLPDRSKLRLPERPKLRLPEKAKFTMKRPNIRLPNALKRSRKPSASLRDQRSTDSTIGGSRRNIFDFSTYPRIFEKKSKTRADDYAATSSPKDSRAQSQESATFPRTRKAYPATTASWAQRYGEPTFDELGQDETAAQRTHPWRHPSLEEPRLSITRLQEEEMLAARLSWEEAQKKREGEVTEEEEEMQYMDYDPDSAEISEGRVPSEKEKRLESGPPPLESDWRPPEVEEEVIAKDGVPFKPMRRSRSLADPTTPFEVDSAFPAVDPRQFERVQLPPTVQREEVRGKEEELEEEEYEEEEEELEEELEELEDRDLSSAHSDREQQSSGSSCDRRRRGIVEDTGSEEYYPRDNMADFDKYFQPTNALADDMILPSPVPPQRPARGSLRKRKEGSVESYDVVLPPARVKRERMVARASEDISDDVFFEERSDSSSRHRVVYQAEYDPRELTRTPANEPLDDIVIVKPARRKSRSSLRSQSQVPIDSDIARNVYQNGDVPRPPPVVPIRRKRARVAKLESEKNGLFPICNGRGEKWEESFLSSSRVAESASARPTTETVMNVQEDKVQAPVPVPPKRRSRSRTISLAQDEDRTSHGAESLPEVDYIQEDIPPDELAMDSMKDLSGYALVDKREKPPRPPPPRRRKIREKFATTPRPSPPRRPQRTYSTLASATKATNGFSSEDRVLEQQQSESMPYIEIDAEDRKELHDDQVLSKIQGRPLPAPPRPPRARKENSLDQLGGSLSELVNEATTATQTDPLPDDMVIEEEVTQAKLIVTTSRSGSQVLVSTERIPSPSLYPISPTSEFSQHEEDKYRRVDTPSSRGPSPIMDYESRFQERRSPDRMQLVDESPIPAPPPPRPITPDMSTVDQSHLRTALRSALLTDETLRISSLEVGDLKVDRLSVSQLETSKILASEVDAILISASELKNLRDSTEDSFSPAIIKELMAIRSHLETVTASQQAKEDRRLLDRESDTESTLKSKSTQEDTLETIDPTSIKSSEIFEDLEKKRSTDLQASLSESKLSLTAEFDILSERRPEISVCDIQEKQIESKEEITEISRDSRSRSSSPTDRNRPVRQTASPVRSLPPVISVTPDTPDTSTPYDVSNVSQPQRAVISYSEDAEKSDKDAPRESSQSPITSNFPSGAAHFIAFPTSQIPAEFFSLATPSPSTRVEPEPSILDSSQQLFRAIRITGAKLMRQFASYLISRVGPEEATEKIRELELALCALLLVITGVLIVYFSNSRTIMHYHHWDYFNPPQ
ncbi:hypothetical protein KPH14_003849 [Odynerus spinipes]|uniref:Uncharacterized protein n=1 Tax=Odynerus spinipes TaxID=1348599 RepID=A0AAD9RXI9_9HYME|nr:hypothetical protein KPH14_003849 [Odynerus spinipes]